MKSVKKECEGYEITESLAEATSELNLVDHVKKQSISDPTSKLALFDSLKTSRKTRKRKSVIKTTPTKVAHISEVNVKQSSQESMAVKSTPTKSNVTKAKTMKSTPLKIAQTDNDEPSNIDQSSVANSSSTQESKENKGQRLNRNICSIKQSRPLAITNNQVKQSPGDTVSIPSDSDDSALDAEEQEFKLKQQAAAEAKIKQEQALSKKSKSVGKVKSGRTEAEGSKQE